jgi:hypothetical protein
MAKMVDTGDCRRVRKSDGLQLSRQYNTLFSEVCAADGRNIEASITELAKLLRDREDLDMQTALTLSANKEHKKRGCCNKR